MDLFNSGGFGPATLDPLNIQGNNSVATITNQQQITAGGPSATLWIFPPKLILDQTRRSHVYNFNGEFRNDLNDHLARMTNGAPVNHIDSLMPGSASAKHAILPSATGNTVMMSALSDNWTFILVVDNSNGLSALGLANSLPSRMLYSGYFMDEPVTNSNFGMDLVTNPNAVLVTTHHTSLVVNNHYTGTGSFNTVNVTGDYDYVPHNLQQLENGDTLYKTTPASIVNNIAVSDTNPNSHIVVGGSPIVGSAKSTEISADHNSPVYQLRSIVGGMSESIQFARDTSIHGTDIFQGGDVIISNLASVLNSGGNSVINSLDPALPFTISDVTARYPNIEVIEGEWPSAHSHDVGSAHAPTRRNVLTHIIQSSVPAVCASLGLASIAFRYNSWITPVGGLGSLGGEKGVFHPLDISTLYGQTSIPTLWGSFQRYMKTVIFPLILANGGEFDVLCYSSLSGSTIVDLKLLDESITPGLLETSTIFGGLNSPLVGDRNILNSNATQMFHALQDVTADIHGTANFGNSPYGNNLFM